jgi:hypothetical protein
MNVASPEKLSGLEDREKTPVPEGRDDRSQAIYCLERVQ